VPSIITLYGVTFMGGFVGFILGTAMRALPNVSIKAAVALIGAALGGAPIMLMSGLGHEKWMYPIGLTFGLMWVRIVSAVKLTREKPKASERVAWKWAWVDSLAILAATLVVLALAAFAS
jgi:hypothetical protein